MLAQLFFVLSQITRLTEWRTDGQTDRQTLNLFQVSLKSLY